MKRSRADDANSSSNPPKKRRITSHSNNKSKMKFPSDNGFAVSVLNQQQENIRNINSLLLVNNKNNALFYELCKYYFDDNIFKKLHNDHHNSNQQIFEFIKTLQQIIKAKASVSVSASANTSTEWILLLKFIVVTLKFHVEFIEQKANNDKAMFIKHCVPTNDLYKFDDKQRIKPFTKYYLNLLQQQSIVMTDINHLLHKYHSHSHSHSHSNAHAHSFHSHRIISPSIPSSANPDIDDNIHSYPVYGEKEENDRLEQQIEFIDDHIASIKACDNEQYKLCQRRLCEANDNKLAEIALELEQTEGFIKNKYEFKEAVIHNEYNDLIDRAKKRLLAKYQNKKAKQERLFKIEFARHQRKRIKTEKQQKNDEIQIETDIYKRRTILKKTTKRKFKDIPQFSNSKMQQKWNAICGIADREMESDVNTMVADQDKGLEIKDILSMFPKCDVSYKSDKNVLQIGACSTHNNASVITLKVASYIACRYTGQSIMLGEVKSISSQGLWCLLRQKGDKLAQYALHHIKVQHIEDGSVKIKLIH